MEQLFTKDRAVKIGERVRTLRRAKEWSQEYLANRIGVSSKTIYRVENGLAPIEVRRLYQIADALEVSIDDIMIR